MSASPASSDHGEMAPLPEGVVPQRCGYRTGKCQNLQAVKRNGTLHKLCDFHREKANQNQKKLDRKKRLMRYAPYEMHVHSDDDSASESAKAESDGSPRSIDAFAVDVLAPHPTSLLDAPLALGQDELELFYDIMMFDMGQLGYCATEPSSLYPRHRHAAMQYIV